MSGAGSGSTSDRPSTGVLVAYYSAYGHVFELARAVAEGARLVDGVEVRLRRFPELPSLENRFAGKERYRRARTEQADVLEVGHDDLLWADGILWGTPTRYGNACAQMRAFLDTTAGLWHAGALESKPAGVFTASATIHGGQESTILTAMVSLLHLGMIVLGLPCSETPEIMTTEPIGGSQYGAGTVTGPGAVKDPDPRELATARKQGARVARAAILLRPLREDRRE